MTITIDIWLNEVIKVLTDKHYYGYDFKSPTFFEFKKKKMQSYNAYNRIRQNAYPNKY